MKGKENCLELSSKISRLDSMRLWRVAGIWLLCLISTFFTSISLTGCNTSHAHEAAAVAHAGGQTAGALAEYYHQMAGAAAGMPQARVIEDSLTAHMVLPEDTKALVQAYHVQAGHYAAREAMARSLKTLYDELGKLANDKPDDVIGAAANLKAAISGINKDHQFNASLHGKRIDSALVQQHMDKVISFLFDLQKAGKLREGNQDTLGVLLELKEVVDEERPLYAEDAAMFAEEGHSLATAMTKAGFAVTPDQNVFGAASPLYELLAPYTLQTTQASPADVANVVQIRTVFNVEESYENARAAARAAPEALQAALDAQVARQEAFVHASR